MSFTEKDLKRLKFHVTGNGPKAFADGVYCEELEALLSRLEAAEKVIEAASGHDEDCDEVVAGYKRCSCGHDDAYKAWWKSKGGAGE